MPDSFVPLVPLVVEVREKKFSPGAAHATGVKLVSEGSAGANSHSPVGNCGKPVVTVQKKGDAVAGVHIECLCGHSIDLSFVY